MGNEGHVVVNGKFNVAAVFFGECRQVDAYARHVHTFARTQGGIVFDVACKRLSVVVVDNQTKVAIVNQDV